MLEPTLVRFLELFGRRQILAIGGHELRADTRFWNPDYPQRPGDEPLFDDDVLTRMYITRRLRRDRIHFNGPCPAGVRGEGASLEHADGPKPFIEAGA